jgi:hypothetical protein
LKAENLIIQGKYVMPIVVKSNEELQKYLLRIQELLISYMRNESYRTDTSNLFSSTFYTVVFMRFVYASVPFWLKIKSIFIDCNVEIENSKYFSRLNNTRDDYPFTIEFRVLS